jgi:hypothetical protein
MRDDSPFTPEEVKELEEVLRTICDLDNKMEEVATISGQRQTIVLYKQYKFRVWFRIQEFFMSQQTPVRGGLGSVSILLANCTVRVYRADFKKAKV